MKYGHEANKIRPFASVLCLLVYFVRKLFSPPLFERCSVYQTKMLPLCQSQPINLFLFLRQSLVILFLAQGTKVMENFKGYSMSECRLCDQTQTK